MNTLTMVATEESAPEAATTVDSRRIDAPAPRRFYRPELDLIRFFAFMAVFVHHGVYTFLPILGRCGAYGLSLFFMLSAFLITELLQREKSSTGNIAIRDFYIRRTLRIWPLYYGFLLFSVCLGLLLPNHGAPLGFFLGFAFMVGNIYIGRHGFPNSPSGFLWSISVEEQFYLFWPLLNRYCSREVLRRIALCAFPLGSAAVIALTAMHQSATIGIWTNSLVEFQLFAWGVLLSLTLNGRIPKLPALGRVALFALGIVLWFAAAGWTGVNDFGPQGTIGPLIGYYLIGLGCAAIFLSAYGMESRWIPAPLVYCGKISYGLYVFHQLALELAEWILNLSPATSSSVHHGRFGVGHLVLGLLFTIAAAILSYKYFETPFLKRKEMFSIVRSRAV